VLRNHVACSLGYSNLFQALCKECKIECCVIEGWVKIGGLENSVNEVENHAWNAVEIAGFWYLIDCTLGSGYISDTNFVQKLHDVYFLMQPQQIINTHFPNQPKWQLLEQPISRDRFNNSPKFFSSFHNHVTTINGSFTTTHLSANQMTKIIFTTKDNTSITQQMDQIEGIERKQIDGQHLFQVTKNDNHFEIIIKFPSSGNFAVIIFAGTFQLEAVFEYSFEID